MNLLKRYKGAIKDFLFSFTAYALPVIALQFAVQPYIAAKAGSEENGLFLALYSIVKLCVSVLIAPLANVRLLNKKNCEENPLHDRGFNALFLLISSVALSVCTVFCFLYRGASADLWDVLRLVGFLLLVCAHDFYAISFRLSINYKMILIDNALIVGGMLAGLLLFRFTGQWEWVFICGYTMGLTFVLVNTRCWRRGVRLQDVRYCIKQYGQLCTSAGLNNATVYCDKLLIYPMIGGYAVSVYNAAAVVSKMVSVVSVPVRNVLLSYIVDKDRFALPRKGRTKLWLLAGGGLVVGYGAFYVASLVFCRLLYPQYFEAAQRYIPFILLAIILETMSNTINVVLLRFAPSRVQIWIFGGKVATYLAGVILLSGWLQMGLFGFCSAILIAALVQMAVVLVYFVKVIINHNNTEGVNSDVS